MITVVVASKRTRACAILCSTASVEDDRVIAWQRAFQHSSFRWVILFSRSISSFPQRKKKCNLITSVVVETVENDFFFLLLSKKPNNPASLLNHCVNADTQLILLCLIVYGGKWPTGIYYHCRWTPLCSVNGKQCAGLLYWVDHDY